MSETLIEQYPLLATDEQKGGNTISSDTSSTSSEVINSNKNELPSENTSNDGGTKIIKI
jgi:hypothetical protein